MKKLLFLLTVTLVALCTEAQFTKATLQATGLTCAMCSNAINKALQKVSFVESVRSDIKNSAFNIVFKQGAAVDLDALKNAVEDAGFSVGGLKVTGTFNDLKVENDKQVQIGDKQFHFLNVSSRTLNGETTITILDRNFVTEKVFKKYSSATKMSCLQTGKTASGERIYHVTI